jgi:hypothetical protein
VVNVVKNVNPSIKVFYNDSNKGVIDYSDKSSNNNDNKVEKFHMWAFEVPVPVCAHSISLCI